MRGISHDAIDLDGSRHLHSLIKAIDFYFQEASARKMRLFEREGVPLVNWSYAAGGSLVPLKIQH